MPNYEIYFGNYGKPLNQKNISREDSLADLNEDDEDDAND